MFAHLRKLQEIADANGGNRAEGTPGFTASIDYVSQQLRDKGFDVQTPEFERLGPTHGGNPNVMVAGRRFAAIQASLLKTTPAGGLKAPTLRPARLAGCATADYAGRSMAGAIAVVDDTGCSIVVKQNIALKQGAVGLLVISVARPSPVGLFTAGYFRQLTVPVGIIDRATDAALLKTTAPVQLTLDSQTDLITSRNVVAQTKTGSSSDVVLVGAHLDSIARAPGINDAGTGVAAVLETARQLGSSPRIANAVRFVFWGAEETGQEGATQYVDALSADQLADIAMYLNFDSIGSVNPGYFTYDGDQSAKVSATPVPDGSAGIERALSGYLSLAGVRPADMPLGEATDYHPFLAAGVPVGGITTGTAQRKTAIQARLWGGKSGAPFDPNYHTPRDDIDNVDPHALSIVGPVVAQTVGAYAQSIDGPNGVPARDKRHRG